MGLPEVCDILWRERELLDSLIFKLDEQHLLLSAGKQRWLPKASREIELVLEQLRLIEVSRAIAVDAVAAELGIEPGASLSALAEAAPAPWNDLLVAHRQALIDASREVCAVADDNRDAVGLAARSAQRMLHHLVSRY
jgi:hypothetical protein